MAWRITKGSAIFSQDYLTHWFTSPQVGRRPLVVASAFATTTVLYLLALVFGWATEERGNSGYESLVILLFYCYVIAFEIGLGPGCWLVPSECFYNDIRMRACLLYTSPSPRDGLLSRMPSSA